MRTLSYQLYSSRNFGPLADTIGMLANLGYKQVEGYSGLYAGIKDLGRFKADLDAAGLENPSGHFGLDVVEADAPNVIEVAKTLGIRNVFVPYLQEEERPSDMQGWLDFGARLSEAGKPIVDAGLTFGWHNHDFEFTPIDGGLPIEGILDGGQDLVFEYDVAWAVRAGQAAEPWIERYGDRIVAAHVKDIAKAGTGLDEDGWADVGDGTVDWPGCLSRLEAAGCDLLIVEHDNPNDDVRFATRSFQYIQSI